jgi:hypothetical protein
MPRSRRPFIALGIALGACVIALVLQYGRVALAAGADAQSKVTEIKQAIAKNQQALAQYTWQQQETVSVNGDVKKQMLYQVEIGPGGKPVKVDISQSASSSGRKFGIRHHITQQYDQYGQQIAALAQSYAQPDPGKLQTLYAQGNVALKSGGAPGIAAVVVSNYVKQGDSVTLTFSEAQKALLGISVATYLSGPSDVVTMAIQFAKLPDGTNHVSTANINGQSKNMTVSDLNTNYQKRTQ